MKGRPARHVLWGLGAAAVLVIAIFLWPAALRPWDAEAKRDDPAEAQVRMKAAVAQNALPLSLLQKASEPSATGEAPLSVEEQVTILNHLSLAKAYLRRSEALAAKPVKVTESETVTVSSVVVPALSIAQLDPVFSALSNASKDFSPTSPVGRKFRAEADAFLQAIQRLPVKHVTRRVEKATGAVTYQAIHLSEDATVSETETGYQINGRSMTVTGTEDGDAAKHLFPAEPPGN